MNNPETTRYVEPKPKWLQLWEQIEKEVQDAKKRNQKAEVK
ncbi:MAG: hypothetical protein QXU18_06400 [Thermoplasmatales archaeon]